MCGGRFGVLRYIVIHSNNVTINNPADSEQRYESRLIPLLGDQEEDVQEHQERRNQPQTTLQVVCEELVDDDDSIDDEVSLATLGGRELESFLNRLRARQTQSSDLGPSADASSQGNPGATSALRAKVMIFSGFCQWGTGQLEREIDRGVWGVVPNGTVEDVLWQDNGPSSGRNLWEHLSQSPRVVPSHDISG